MQTGSFQGFIFILKKVQIRFKAAVHLQIGSISLLLELFFQPDNCYILREVLISVLETLAPFQGLDCG